MGIKWGNSDLKVIYTTYKPFSVGDIGLNEIKLLPKPLESGPQTVLQQGGRNRKRLKFDSFVSSIFDYEQLMTDFVKGSERDLTDLNGITHRAIVGDLGEPDWNNSDFIKFSIEFVEV